MKRALISQRLWEELRHLVPQVAGFRSVGVAYKAMWFSTATSAWVVRLMHG